MKQSTHPSLTDLPLDQLVSRALDALKNLRYSRRSLRRYREIWRRFVAYCHEMNLEDTYSVDLATQFCSAYQMRDGVCLESNEGWRRHVVFSLKVLGDFVRDGRISRAVTDMQRIQIPSFMKKPMSEYDLYCRDRLYIRPITLRARMREISIFVDFLGSRNITSFDQLQPTDISTFVISRRHLKAKTVSGNVSDVRCFLRFLLLRGFLQRDLSYVLPKISVPRDATIPSVWDPELVVRLLNVIDRSSPKGKRDYAILLLACRLGLRSGDIRALKLDNINWEAATIEITQSKTLTQLRLPLTEEVGEALIDYLRSGRPQVEHREVFLTLISPFLPFSETNNLHRIIDHWKKLAGIHFRAKQRHGLRSLRHTLATQLLREQTPFHVISDILGHATTASTLIYAKVDVETLRTAALNTEGVCHVK